MDKEIKDLLRQLKQVAESSNEDMDLEDAATLLLRFNRNRILHQNIIRARLYDKLRYEAKKTLLLECARRGIDPASLEESEAAGMEEKEKECSVVVSTLEEKEKGMGKRPDHEQLPESIQKLYSENLNAFMRMRKLHETLKNMDNAKACDRFPYVDELLKLDDKVIKNWKMYDAYRPGEEESKSEDPEVDAKRISANRKYISGNKEKLAGLLQENPAKAEELKAKMQVRVDELLACNAGISDEQLTELSKLGIHV